MDGSKVVLNPGQVLDAGAGLYRRIGWRLLPILMLGYVFAFMDRINVGFAVFQMKADLGFSDAVYGLGAGLFFISYLVFEIPSNLLLPRIGARLTISRIMLCWGVTSCAMVFVRTPTTFYILRLLLGLFEAGFTPGVALYLTYWYPEARLAQVTAAFLGGGVIAGLVGSPVSGLILDVMNDAFGLRGWQWLFLLEGLPSIALGVVALFLLPNGPKDAKWLTDGERDVVVANVSGSRSHDVGGFGAALRDRNVYATALAWFALTCGIYAVSFWMPLMLKGAGGGLARTIGVLSSIPYAVALVSMLLLSRSSDRTGERRWHVAACSFIAALSFLSLPLSGGGLLAMLGALTIATAALFSAIPILISIPMSILPKRSAPGGIALINTIGQSAGFLSPFLLGWVKTHTGNLNIALYAVAFLLVIGSLTTIAVVRER